MMEPHALYIRWLRAAYLYYITPGEDTGVQDYTWDHWSRELFGMRAFLPVAEYPVVHREEFIGGSLFWLKRDEYPAEALPA
jgi:hypothetical protein